MAEILLPDCQFRRLSDGATCRDIHAETLCQACTAHVQVAALRTHLGEMEWRLGVAEQTARKETERADLLFIENTRLRTRLESVEAARRDAREGRFDVIIENEELGAELAALRTRLESAEAALCEIRATSREYDGVASTAARYNRCLRIVDTALGAAGERSEG